jgi:hypothetical protein
MPRQRLLLHARRGRGFVGQNSFLAIIEQNLGQFPGVLVCGLPVARDVRDGCGAAFNGCSFDYVQFPTPANSSSTAFKR